MSIYWTDFREYVRGKFPSDWTQRVTTLSHLSVIEGAWSDGAHKNYFQLSGPGSRTVFTFNPPDADANLSNQELLILFRVDNLADRGLACLCVQSGADTMYRIGILASSSQIRIEKIIAGAQTTLATGAAGTGTVKNGGYYYLRFRKNGTTLSAVLWPYTTLSGLFSVTATDSTLSTGSVGFQTVAAVTSSASESWRVLYAAFATNGDTAPLLDDVLVTDPPLSQWINQPGTDSITSVRVEYYNPSTNTVSEEWVSTEDVNTSVSDYPSNVVMKPLLLDAGTITRRLEGDIQFGKSGSTSSPIRFENIPASPTSAGPFDVYQTYSFSGRPIEIRMGRKWQTPPVGMTPGVLNPHRRYEVIQCATVSMPNDEGAREVTVTPTDVQLNIESTPSFLNNKLPVYRNIGIPTGIKSLSGSGFLRIPSNATYELTSFCVYLRFMCPVGGVAGSGVSFLSDRETDATHRQWFIGLGQVSHANANKVILQSWSSGGVLIAGHTSTKSYNLARYIDLILGVDGSNRIYLVVDKERIYFTNIASSPTVASGAVTDVLSNVSVGLCLVDHRIEKFISEDEAIARFSTRREPDTLTLSMHRCDEASGATVTDYAILANHGTLQGTDAVDRVRTATYLGSPEQAGTPMPISGGALFHAPAQNIDNVRNIYRYNDRAKTTGVDTQIRAKGLVLSAGVAWTDGAFEAVGTADLVSTPDEPITFGSTVSVPATALESEEIHVPRLVKDELVNRGILTQREIDRDSFSALRTLLPVSGGFYYSEPPMIRDFLSDMLGGGESGSSLKGIASHFQIDRYSRLVGGFVTPPANPGPYGQGPLLEFLGLTHKGVTFSANSGYSLKQDAAGFSLVCWFKVPTRPVDISTSNTFTYFPQGQTLIDRCGISATGYYLGIDGRDGNVIFGAPGVTNTSGGLHFSKVPLSRLDPGSWILVCTQQTATERLIVTSNYINGVAYYGSSVQDATTGSMTDPVDEPLRIGTGPRGSFTGPIQYAFGTSPGNNPGLSITALQSGAPLQATWTPKFWAELREGSGSFTVETVQNQNGYIEGARWCPAMTLDFTSIVPDPVPEPATFDPLRRPTFAFRTEARYFRNYLKLEGAQVAGGVTPADRTSLQREYLSEPDLDQTTRDNYKDSRELITLTPIYRQDNADFIASMIRGRISADRRYGGVTNWVRELLRLNPTDEILLKHDRFLSTGRAMRVVNILYKLGLLRGDVGLWG